MKHGPWCGLRIFPIGQCRCCETALWYLSCDCGCRVLFDRVPWRHGEWRKHFPDHCLGGGAPRLLPAVAATPTPSEIIVRAETVPAPCEFRRVDWAAGPDRRLVVGRISEGPFSRTAGQICDGASLAVGVLAKAAGTTRFRQYTILNFDAWESATVLLPSSSAVPLRRGLTVALDIRVVRSLVHPACAVVQDVEIVAEDDGAPGRPIAAKRRPGSCQNGVPSSVIRS